MITSLTLFAFPSLLAGLAVAIAVLALKKAESAERSAVSQPEPAVTLVYSRSELGAPEPAPLPPPVRYQPPVALPEFLDPDVAFLNSLYYNSPGGSDS